MSTIWADKFTGGIIGSSPTFIVTGMIVGSPALFEMTRSAVYVVPGRTSVALNVTSTTELSPAVTVPSTGETESHGSVYSSINPLIHQLKSSVGFISGNSCQLLF